MERVICGILLVLMVPVMCVVVRTVGAMRLGGIALLGGGLAWMFWLGGMTPTGLEDAIDILALEAMAALAMACGGMMIAWMPMR